MIADDMTLARPRLVAKGTETLSARGRLESERLDHLLKDVEVDTKSTTGGEEARRDTGSLPGGRISSRAHIGWRGASGYFSIEDSRFKSNQLYRSSRVLHLELNQGLPAIIAT